MGSRVLLGAFGDAGHAFPLIALGTELAERGHEVCLQTWERWREGIEAAGMRFDPAPEYSVFPTRDTPLKPYEAVVRAASDTLPLLNQFKPDLVLADILTLAPALAGEIEDVPVATFIPHLYPVPPIGGPPFSIGARPPRTGFGKSFWAAMSRVTERGLRQGRSELNETRRRLGLPPLQHFHGGLSEKLCLVGTLPQLEYRNRWPRNTFVTGPLMWEPKSDEVELPEGDEPLVLVAPSTAQDPEFRLLKAALDGLAGLPVRVIATSNRPLDQKITVPDNAQLVEWLSYSQVMPHCDLVIAHGGHGTVCRALSYGVPLVLCPAGGDMYENAARVTWAGLGARIPHRALSPASVKLASQSVLADDQIRAKARKTGLATSQSSPAAKAATLIEQLSASG